MRTILFFILLPAVVFEAQGQTQQAAQFFSEGVAASRNGDHETALRCYTAALDDANEDARDRAFQAKVNYNIGVSAYQLGKFDVAIERLETAISLSGKVYEKAYYALGMTYAETGDWAPARDAFRQAIAINEKNGETWFDLAFAYLALGEQEMAIAAFARSVKHKTVDRPIAENNLGVLFANKGELRKAEMHFENAVRLAGGAFTIASENLNECRQMARSAGGGERRTAAVNFRFAEKYIRML
jgi:tetratricopeptide (TPR) repeat protein